MRITLIEALLITVEASVTQFKGVRVHDVLSVVGPVNGAAGRRIYNHK